MTPKLQILDLFSGIGGFSLGLERTGGFETAAFCEIEEFPRKVLRKHWPDTPIFEDVRKLRGEDVGPVDVICGGYPCQPFSLAGKRAGAEDDRHLWPEFDRLVDELRPAWVIGENVAGHIGMGLDQVLSDLEGKGYACRTFVIPACAVDAPHRRDRVWIVAHTERQRSGGERGKTDNEERRASQDGAAGIRQGHGPVGSSGPDTTGEDVANASGRRRGKPGTGQDQLPRRAEIERGSEDVADPNRDDAGAGKFWLPEPSVGRVANGIPQRVDRLKALGNAVVPQIPEMIGHAILHAEASD